jgi:hypothetical protein
VETVLPALAYERGCSSAIELRNLGSEPAVVDVEAHRPDGTLVALPGALGMRVHLAPGETIRKEIAGAWVKIREAVSDGAWPAVGVQGNVECQEGATMQTVAREAAYPARNPWFAGDVTDVGEGSILLINTSEHAGKASLCYSSGAEYSLPGAPFRPICLAAFDVQIPPFGSRTFSVRRGASTHFELRTWGDRMVLQMLRPVAGSTRVFAVDSSISFGGEASQTAPQSSGSAVSATPPRFP